MRKLILLSLAFSLVVLAAAPCLAQTDSMYVDSNGNVGVGTSTPSSAFEVQRSDGSAQILVQELSGTTAARDLLVLTNPGATRFLFSNSASGQSWEFKLNAGDDFAINNPAVGGPELLVSKTGDLTVTGDIFSQTCSGTPCAPDFVFDPSYELMPVSDLDSFVRQNQHLPGVPPAAELTGPVNVSKLQMTLLQKVEELTLYVIALDRENQQLRQEVEALRQRSDGRK